MCVSYYIQSISTSRLKEHELREAMIGVILLVFVFTLCKAQLNCTNSTYDVYYFNKCILDEPCQRNFHLHSDEQWAFTRMLNEELLEPMHLNATEICGDEVIWMAVLRTFDVCSPNHRRDFDGSCILIGDKLEDPPIWHRTGLAALTSPLINVGVLIIVLWLASRQLDNWRNIQTQLDIRQQQLLPTEPEPTLPVNPDVVPVGRQLIFKYH